MIDRKQERSLVFHKGIYKKALSTSEAVFMITGMTIGAGVLGVPYVVAQVGLLTGMFYILILGLVVMFLNLIIGEIAVRTGESLQLAGFAGKYIGGWAKKLLSFTIVLSGYGSLLAYISGEGQALSALFGGNSVWWSLMFWSVASFMVWRGLQTVKKLERVLSFTVISIIVGLSLFLLRDLNPANLFYLDVSKIFLPYGVILFALHASPAIAEAHAVLPGSQKRFKRAVILGTMIPTVVYMLFALAVVGVSGLSTTQVATIGLGEKYGPTILILANSFAVLAMGTAFMGMGMALKQTFVWDHKIPKWVADILVMIVPLALFAAGIRNFVMILDVVGGLFVGVEAILMVAACYLARKHSRLKADRYEIRNFWLFALPVLIIFSFATIFTVIKLFVQFNTYV